jgi:hypothetical protein
MLSSGLFPGVCSLNGVVSEHRVWSIFIGGWVWSVTALRAPCGANYLLANLVTPPHPQPQSHSTPTHLWRWNTHSVSKRWHLNCRRRSIFHRKHATLLWLIQITYNLLLHKQNTAVAQSCTDCPPTSNVQYTHLNGPSVCRPITAARCEFTVISRRR